VANYSILILILLSRINNRVKTTLQRQVGEKQRAKYESLITHNQA